MNQRLKPWLSINFHIFWNLGAECGKIPVTHKEKTRRHLPGNSKDSRNKLIFNLCLLRMLLTYLQLICQKWRVQLGEGSSGKEIILSMWALLKNVYLQDIYSRDIACLLMRFFGFQDKKEIILFYEWGLPLFSSEARAHWKGNPKSSNA